SDLLIIDGIGGLEGRGKGFFPALAWARALRTPELIVLSSRHDQIPDIATRLALPPEQVAMGPSTDDSPEVLAQQVLAACQRPSRQRRASRGA
ncbi:MAG: hypothetical protein ACOC1F_04795, partial [Myxococcota bacterium]